MSEPKTALDLADRWTYLRRIHRCDDADEVMRQLAAIPADAAARLDLRDEETRRALRGLFGQKEESEDERRD